VPFSYCGPSAAGGWADAASASAPSIPIASFERGNTFMATTLLLL
jgi:hypothetical protein